MSGRNKRRADGRIATQISWTSGNKKHSKTLYAYTHQELKQKEIELRRKLGLRLDISAEDDTFGEWCDKLMALKKMEVSHNWYANLMSYTKHLAPLWHLPLIDIKSYDIQTLIYTLDLSTQTLSVIKGIILQVYQLAIDNRVLEYNPATNVKVPQKPSKIKRRALTEAERQWIIDTPHRCQLPAMIMMFAGLRRGELIPLTWSDIDLTAKTININKSVEMVGNQPAIKDGGKTASATRVVHIPQLLVDYLAQQKRTSINVCVSAKGEMLTETAFRRMWDSYMAELNYKYGDFSHLINYELPKSRFAPKKIPQVIPPITPHWLRHTFASLLYMAGVDALTAKEQLGHNDIKTTLNIYTHLDKVHKVKNINKLDSFLQSF